MTKGQYPEPTKNLNLQEKNNNNAIKKWVKGINRHFSKEDIMQPINI